MDPLLIAIIGGILAVALYAPLSTYRSWRRYFADDRVRFDARLGHDVPDRSKLLLLLAWISTDASLALGMIGAIALRRLFPTDPFEYTGHVLGVAIIMLGLVPYIIDRAVVWIQDSAGGVE